MPAMWSSSCSIHAAMLRLAQRSSTNGVGHPLGLSVDLWDGALQADKEKNKHIFINKKHTTMQCKIIYLPANVLILCILFALNDRRWLQCNKAHNKLHHPHPVELWQQRLVRAVTSRTLSFIAMWWFHMQIMHHISEATSHHRQPAT